MNKNNNQQLDATLQAKAVVVSAEKVKNIGQSFIQIKKEEISNSGQDVEAKVEVMEKKVDKIVEKAETKGGKLEMSEEHVEQIIDNDNYVNSLNEACGEKEYLTKSMNTLREDPYYASLLSNTSVDGIPLDYKAEMVAKYGDSDISIEEAIRTDMAEKLNLVNSNDPALNHILHTINDYRGGGLLDKKKKVSELNMTKEDGSVYDLEDKRDMYFGEEGEGGKRYGWKAIDGQIVVDIGGGEVMRSEDIYSQIDESLANPDITYQDIVESKKEVVLPLVDEIRKEKKTFDNPQKKSYYMNLLQMANNGEQITEKDMEGLSQRHKQALINIMMAGMDAEQRTEMATSLHWKTALDTGILFVTGPVGYGVFKGLESLHNKTVEATRPKELEILVNEEKINSNYDKLLYYANKGAEIPLEVMNSLSEEERKRIKGIIASNAQIEVTQAEQDATSKEFESWLIAEEILVPVGAGMIGSRLLAKKMMQKGLTTTVSKQIASKETKALLGDLTEQEVKALPKMTQEELEVIAKRLGTTVDKLPGVATKQLAQLEKKTLTSLGKELSEEEVDLAVRNIEKKSSKIGDVFELSKLEAKNQKIKDALLKNGYEIMRAEDDAGNVLFKAVKMSDDGLLNKQVINQEMDVYMKSIGMSVDDLENMAKSRGVTVDEYFNMVKSGKAKIYKKSPNFFSGIDEGVNKLFGKNTVNEIADYEIDSFGKSVLRNEPMIKIDSSKIVNNDSIINTLKKNGYEIRTYVKGGNIEGGSYAVKKAFTLGEKPGVDWFVKQGFAGEVSDELDDIGKLVIKNEADIPINSASLAKNNDLVKALNNCGYEIEEVIKDGQSTFRAVKNIKSGSPVQILDEGMLSSSSKEVVEEGGKVSSQVTTEEMKNVVEITADDYQKYQNAFRKNDEVLQKEFIDKYGNYQIKETVMDGDKVVKYIMEPVPAEVKTVVSNVADDIPNVITGAVNEAPVKPNLVTMPSGEKKVLYQGKLLSEGAYDEAIENSYMIEDLGDEIRVSGRYPEKVGSFIDEINDDYFTRGYNIDWDKSVNTGDGWMFVYSKK